MRFVILGAGAWGTALSLHLVARGHPVTLVPRRLAHARQLRSAMENQDYLKGFRLPDELVVEDNMRVAIHDADVLILACPSFGLRDLCRQIDTYGPEDHRRAEQIVISLAKGIEAGTLDLPSRILATELHDYRKAVLSGPNFAREVAAGLPAAAVLATALRDDASRAVQEALSGPSFRVYLSGDVIGVELGGALKNVYAIAAGITCGLGLGENALASLLTRILAEMSRVVTALGGQADTVQGLSGFGDLVLTSTSRQSRNFRLGEGIARGEAVDRQLSGRKDVVEGYRTCACFHDLVRRAGVDAPVLEQVHDVVYREKDPRDGLKALMSRALKTE
ncbi:MAG: NAD(P)H-dependent glycerol-3-phosphate dehydrogenase [Opitutales bacterium]